MGVAQNRSGWFQLTRRLLVSILLLAIAVTSVLVYVYYSVSVTSVTGVTIEQVFADRKLLNGTYPNRNATFLFEIRLWSPSQYFSVNVEKPFFVVEISGANIWNQTLNTGIIYPGADLIYNLRFTLNQSRVGYEPFTYASDPVDLKVATRLTSGFYTQSAIICSSVTWNWTTASILSNDGSTNRCSI